MVACLPRAVIAAELRYPVYAMSVRRTDRLLVIGGVDCIARSAVPTLRARRFAPRQWIPRFSATQQNRSR